MSKAALGLLLKGITKEQFNAKYERGDNNTPFQRSIDKGSKPYRKQVLDKNLQFFDLGDEDHIAKQLKLEVLGAQPDLAPILPDPVFAEAARSLVKAFDVGGAKNKDETTGLYTYKSYDAMQKNLAKGNQAAFAVINAAITKAGASINTRQTLKGETVPVFSSNLTVPDHELTNAEVRFSEVFNRGLKDPLATIKKLREFGGLSVETETVFVEEFTKITSYYTANNTKAFDITTGAKVKLRSNRDNEIAGRELTLSVTDQLREAAAKAVANNEWSTQDGSDSYVKALLKTFNNIAVSHGAKGKKQIINTGTSTVSSSRKTPIKISKSVPAKKKVVRQPPKPKAPLISLQSIVNYINRRLPEAVRGNMGEGTLVNRSGRFANSAQLVGGSITPQGFPSLAYTYQRSPYDVFDRTLGRAPWNTPGRDPKKLIEKSVREIAQEMAIGRFYLRRV